jgi:hypothetical protein
MKKLSNSDKTNAAAQLPDLEFPITDYFCPTVKNLSPTEYHQWCVEMMAGHKDDPAARLAEKCAVEFVL